MKISTKSRYAVRVMLDVLMQEEKKPVSIKDIAERQELSVKYIEQIMVLLVRAGLLRSIRGSQGGYEALRPAREYTVGEIMRGAEGEIAPVDCSIDPGACEKSASCMTYGLWKGLYETVNRYLDSITLQDLLDKAVHSSDYYSI